MVAILNKFCIAMIVSSADAGLYLTKPEGTIFCLNIGRPHFALDVGFKQFATTLVE